MPIWPQTERAEAIDDGLVVVGRLTLDEMEGEVEVEVAGTDVGGDTGRRFGGEQSGDCSSDDRQVTTPERAAEGANDVGGDAQQSLAHRIVVVSCPSVVSLCR